MRILVTGGSGFVGRALLNNPPIPAFQWRGAFRTQTPSFAPGFESVSAPDLSANADWTNALRDVDAIVHTAARVHVMRPGSDEFEEFRRVNVEGTIRLAQQAAAAGVRRFVFISSIKVNGEVTPRDNPFTADSPPAPVDAYGRSKLEAEERLWELSAQSGLEVVCVRPVLVYGPGVKANFHAMLRWLDAGIPLPFAAVDNRRSILAIDNLIDLIGVCITHSAAINQVFLASDGADLSTPQLLRKAAAALGRPARLYPVPVGALYSLGRLSRRREVIQRLCGSLQVDIGKNKELLGWEPKVTSDAALSRTAVSYRQERRFK